MVEKIYAEKCSGTGHRAQGAGTLRRLVFACALCLVPCAQVHAETLDLGQIVVTPYRYAEALGRTVSDITVITAGNIQGSGAGKVVDLLRPLPGLNVRDVYGNGTKAAVDINGFGEQAFLNVLVLVDGRRSNSGDLNGVDWGQIPLDEVERIEVVRGGSGAVLYGDNAASGVINIITKRGAGQPRVNLAASYGSYDMNSQQLSVGGGKKALNYWFSGGRDATHGYRQNTFTKNSDYAAKIGYDLSDTLSMRLDTALHASTYGIPGALYQDNIDQFGRRYARFPKDHANNRDHYVLWGTDYDLGGKGQLGMDVSYRRNDTDSYFLSSGNPTRRNGITTVGVAPKYTLAEDLSGHNNRFITGLDYYHVYYDSDDHSKTTDARSSYTRIRKTSVGGYLQDEFSATDKLVLLGGYRHEAARFSFGYHDLTGWNPDISDKTRPKMDAFNTGAVYTYQEGSNAFLNVSKSFRFPVVDEFTFVDPDYKQQLNPDLKPQSSINFETGLRHKFSDDLKGSLSVFRMNVKDEIFFNSKHSFLQDPWSLDWYWAGENTNYDRTVHQGVETSLQAKLNDRLTTFGSYTFTDARFDGGVYDENEIPVVPRHKASLGLRVQLKKELAWNILGTYVGERYFYNDQANTYSRLNGYFVADTSLTVGRKDWSFTFGVNNVLDKKYAEYAGVRVTEDGVYGYHVGDKFYFPAPERNFTLKAEYSF
jgi:iron complex outermembrane recepter protein